jgi:uncharacterized protein (DUF1810 family)
MISSINDPWNLGRYVIAQNDADTYLHAIEELRHGRKVTHWMWFIFPQIVGLGQSTNSRRYAISCLDEAKAYLLHPILGPRLVECTTILIESKSKDAPRIFGDLDAQKLGSSMTLFMRAALGENIFKRVIDMYFGGVADEATERLL